MINYRELGQYTIVDYPASALSELEHHWHKLEQGLDMTAFQTYDWHSTLFNLYKQEHVCKIFRSWRYILVLSGEKPVLIAPLELRRFGIRYRYVGASRGVYFTGRMGHTDYLNFIYDSFNPQALQLLIDYVCKQYHMKRFCLERIPAWTQSFKWLEETFKSEHQPVSCAALTLPNTFEEYRLSLSKSTRQNIRTAINRANRNGIILTHELVLNPDLELQNQLDVLNKQRLKKKSAASKRQMSIAGSIYCFCSMLLRKLFCAKPDVIHQSKNTFCFLVRDNQKIVSFFWGIYHLPTMEYYVILVGVDQDYEWYSPNISHLYTFIEEYYSTDKMMIKVLDFTRGAEGYKKTIGCTNRPVCSLTFHAK